MAAFKRLICCRRSKPGPNPPRKVKFNQHVKVHHANPEQAKPIDFKLRLKAIRKPKIKHSSARPQQSYELSQITLLQDKLSQIVADCGLSSPERLNEIKTLVRSIETHQFDSDEQLAKPDDEVRQFIQELGDTIDTEGLL